MAREKSPYLLQHAQNPVDWFPWGKEAFAAAKKADKPVFLSIGYSTCHWCHVMEHESFEDEETARLLNEAFVCVKVDREERPDIDQTYMRVCQMLTGSGGWPLTIVMTPEGRPFFAATYIPRGARFGRIGLHELVPRLQEAWRTRRDELVRSADEIVGSLTAQPKAGAAAAPLDEKTLKAAADQLSVIYDPEHGGFGGPPKFPTPHQLVFLLRYSERTGDPEPAQQVYHTLRKMREGGIFDHVGFGFHRYSTDREWFVPHFEKMLYDQALLVWAYAEAYQRSRDPLFAQTVHEVVSYVTTVLLAPEGAFHSAEDADSEGVEGKFYAWTWGELERLVGPSKLRWMAPLFGLVPDGNLRDEAHGTATGTNHFHQRELWATAAADEGVTVGAIQRNWEAVRRELEKRRRARVRPGKDDKILTDWNGLMIAALARASRALGDTRYQQAAVRAADFVLTQMRDRSGNLLHRYREREASILGFLDDHAFLAWGLLELYEATGEVRYLGEGLRLVDAMNERFWNAERGGYDFTSKDHEALIARDQEWHDGAVPAGNSVALLVLLRASRLTGRTDLEARAEELRAAAAVQVGRGPAAFAQFLVGLDFGLGPAKEIVLAGDVEDDAMRAFERIVDEAYLPRAVTIRRSASNAAELAKLAPFTKLLGPGAEGARAFVCEWFRCELPVDRPEALRAQLTSGGEGVRRSSRSAG